MNISDKIVNSGGVVDYIECVNSKNLEEMPVIEDSALIAVAAFYGKTRIIDNCLLTSA